MNIKNYTWLWQLLPIALMAWLCIATSNLFVMQKFGISPLTIAIVLGMVFGNSILSSFSQTLSDGIIFSKARLLRAGIVLFGLKLTLAQVAYVGWPAILSDLVIIIGTMWLSVILGKRMGVEIKTAALIGSGSAICGAAAVLATQPVLKNKESDVSVAVATVVVFGTLAMFVYPIAGRWLLSHYDSAAAWFSWGIYTGSSIHEVAQVAAAGAAVNDTVGDVAVMTKMIRVMLLAPFLLVLPYAMRGVNDQKISGGKIIIPWFAVGFLLMVAANSMFHIPNNAYRYLIKLDTFLLTMSMLCLGFTTRWQTIRQAGSKPLLLAGLLWLWLIVAGAVVSYLCYLLFQ